MIQWQAFLHDGNDREAARGSKSDESPLPSGVHHGLIDHRRAPGSQESLHARFRADGDRQ